MEPHLDAQQITPPAVSEHVLRDPSHRKNLIGGLCGCEGCLQRRLCRMPSIAPTIVRRIAAPPLVYWQMLSYAAFLLQSQKPDLLAFLMGRLFQNGRTLV